MLFQFLTELALVVLLAAGLYLLAMLILGKAAGKASALPDPSQDQKDETGDQEDDASSLQKKIEELEKKKTELKQTKKEIEVSAELRKVESELSESRKKLALLETQQPENPL